MAENMDQTMKLRIVIDHVIKKLVLPNGIPSTVQDLHTEVKHAFDLREEFSLQYKDLEFDDFFTLTSTTEIKDKDTLKIVYVPPPPVIFTMLPGELPRELLEKETAPIAESTPDQSIEDDTLSSDSQNTVIISPSERQEAWPAVFPVPTFSLATEMLLATANEEYLKNGTLLTSPRVKSDILERLAETMYSYTAYPSDAQRLDVVEALIKKHPSLKEPGSFSGYYGWQQSLKYKVSNYRTKLRATGAPELLVNTLKHKCTDDKKPAKNVKKPRKAEVNYLPAYPPGESAETMEIVRLDLIGEMKKRGNDGVIREMMAKTYSHRRQEVVGKSPSIEDLKERWPALFEASQINEEFQRCNAVSLEATFMQQLDRHTPKLLTLFSEKGGAVGQRIKTHMSRLTQDPCCPIDTKREVVLRCLIEYRGERGEELIKDYHGAEEDDILEDLKDFPMKIYVCREPDTIGIIIEGLPVLAGVSSVARACCLLLGLTYAVNLEYPVKLQHTFEVFQRLFMGLDPKRPKQSPKYITLKNKLLA